MLPFPLHLSFSFSLSLRFLKQVNQYLGPCCFHLWSFSLTPWPIVLCSSHCSLYSLRNLSFHPSLSLLLFSVLYSSPLWEIPLDSKHKAASTSAPSSDVESSSEYIQCFQNGNVHQDLTFKTYWKVFKHSSIADVLTNYFVILTNVSLY